MADLKPLGSEKLQGMDKIKRILEIARYNETPKQEINELSTLNYTIKLADGNTYGIVKERLGYIIKQGINESNLDYTDSIRHRKYFRSYSEAMKKLNLLAGELNRVHENENEIPLIGEQRFVLRTKKKSKPVTEPSVETPPPPVDMGASAPPPADMGAGAPPADMGTPPPPADMGTSTPPPMEGGDMGTPPAEGGDMGAEAPPMGGEEGMGLPPEDMGSEVPPMGGEEDMGGEPPMGGESDETGEPYALKTIQKLTGKLGQKIRAYDKEKGMDSQDIKYVVNSILSAIDLENLDEDDKEDILSKFEESDDYGAEGPGELDLGSEDEFDMGGEEPMSTEEPMMSEPKETYGYMTDSIYSESKVEKVLSKYFDIKPSEKTILENKKKKQFLKEKINKIETKNEIHRLSETKNQRLSAFYLLEENTNAKIIGLTNKKNLVFTINGKQVKVTPNGDII